MLAVAIGAAIAWWQGTSQTVKARVSPIGPTATSSREWWYSRILDTSAPTVANGRGKPGPQTLEKWADRDGHRFLRTTIPGSSKLTDLGFLVGGGPPGFADWDPLGVTTLPGTPLAIRALLSSARLSGSYPRASAAERHSPLTELAELAAMLADDPTTPGERAAAITVVDRLPGLRRLGTSHDAHGHAEITVAERATGLHPFVVAAGPGCHSPYGGRGCVRTATPRGSFELRLTYDPTSNRPRSVETVALRAIPRARITAGSAVYRVSYQAGRSVKHPHIPPLPTPARAAEQSVPWTLRGAVGRTIRVSWQSGTCLPGVAPHAHIRAIATPHAVTIAVIARVAKAGPGSICAGVGLGGTLSTTLAHPIAGRTIKHATVTDHDR